MKGDRAATCKSCCDRDLYADPAEASVKCPRNGKGEIAPDCPHVTAEERDVASLLVRIANVDDAKVCAKPHPAEDAPPAPEPKPAAPAATEGKTEPKPAALMQKKEPKFVIHCPPAEGPEPKEGAEAGSGPA